MEPYISKIKCRNFKSFRNVSVDLIKGFQAFMGPNGSGKSNLCDLIRFALGETRLSALRAKTIKDLINHNADYAEATIIIDTHNGELSVCRRINREGKSVYLLNGKRRSRGDIIETLKKYYIENGAHNVIGQGEVQRIVEMGPVEKRKIIDEIAGVAEFDAKKNEAVKELDTVQQRINDTKLVLKEREGYIKELEKERESALEYMKIKKEAVNLRNSVIYLEIRKIEEEYESVTKEYAMKKTRVSDINDEIGKIEDRIEKESIKIRELSERINEKSTSNKAYSEYEALRTNVAVASGKKDMLIKKRDELNKRLEGLGAKKDEIEEQLKSHCAVAGEDGEKLSALRGELGDIKRRSEMARKRDSTLVNESLNLGGEIAKLERDIERIERRRNELSLAISRNEYAVKVKLEELEKNNDLIEKGNEKGAKEIEREIRELEKNAEQKRKKLDALFGKERKCNERNAEIDKQLLKLKDEHSRYRAVSGRMQSENVVRFINELKNKNAVEGIYGAVHELCSFDSKYATAIESAVGGRLNYIIVEDVDVSKNVIEELRGKKIGRATFLPLNMKVNIGKQGMNFPGVLGRLIDFIEYDPKYSGPMHYVFGDAVLVTDIETAKDVGLIGKARIVTLQGDVIEKSSAVTGGHFVSGFRLKEKRKVAELEQKIGRLQREKEESVNELYELRNEAAKLRRERGEIEVRMRSLQIEMETLSKNEEQIGKCREIAKNIRRELDELGREKRSADREYGKICKNAERDRERLDKMRARKADIDAALFKKSGDDEKRMSELIDEISKLEGEVKGKSAEVDMLRKNALGIEEEMKAVGGELTAVEREIGEIESNVAKMNEEISEKKSEMEKASRKIRELMKKQEEIQQVLDAYAEQKGRSINEKERVVQEVAKAEMKKAVLEQRLADLKAEASDEEFELIRGSVGRLKSELRERELKLESMGEVNLLAPKAYDEKKREMEEVGEKLTRLEKEREAVIEMINEVEKRKVSVCMEAFSKVSENFSNLFSQTFSNGAAFLKLQNDKNPFEGGLDVKIVRDGSKEERIESLSGGERSVIAILLVFAMHMYRPSAFYILDEVESALDKVRSKLLADLLNKLSGKTQFIVVSHNDTVISSAHAVIGVSKTPKGSKVISLALNRAVAAPVKNKGGA